MTTISRALPTRVRSLTVLAAFAGVYIACGGGDKGPAPTAVQHPPEIQQAIDDLELKVGFRPYAPTYLPDGIGTTPETAHVNDEDQQTAIVAFFPLEGDGSSRDAPVVIELTEEPAKNFVCPLCPGEGFTDLEISGKEALSEEGEITEEGKVYYVLYFNVGHIFVTLNAEWQVPSGTELDGPTDQMKQEMVRVAESMLDQV